MAQLKLTIDCFKKICRTCLSTVNKLRSLKSNLDLQQMLTQWTPIEYDLRDFMPKQMCVICVSRLNNVHNFNQMCVRAESDLRQAIENDKEALLPYLETLMNECEENEDSEDDSDENVEDEGDAFSNDSNLSFSLYSEELFEWEEHKLKVEAKHETETSYGCDLSQIVITNVESIPEEASDENNESDDESCSFRGFNSEEINSARIHLQKYTESVQQTLSAHKPFFDSIKFKCYLCKNNMNLSCDKPNIKSLEFSTLNDDAHVLCKLRVKVLRKIIKELYLKLDEMRSFNNSWQKLFLQEAERNNNARVQQFPTNRVNATLSKPYEIGYRKDGQVYLGHLTWIPEPEFDKAFHHSLSPNKFLVNMALTIFGAETLAKSTITGISKNGVKKEPLNSIRMCALKSSLKFYMNEYNVPDYYQKHIWKDFNKILGQKIAQITKAYKKRCLELSARDENNKKMRK